MFPSRIFIKDNWRAQKLFMLSSKIKTIRFVFFFRLQNYNIFSICARKTDFFLHICYKVCTFALRIFS